MYIKVRPATRHAWPGTHHREEIKIAPKKATKVPKFTFGKGYKDLASRLP